MRLLSFDRSVPAWLGEALERFETQFEYPLGEDERFRISHGQEYLTFFNAMGKALLHLIELNGEVLGTLVQIERQLHSKAVHYLCDLKIIPSARGGGALLLLMSEARRRIQASSSHSSYCIVMEGTGRLPTEYTGRVGVPGFEKLGEIVVLRFTEAGSVSPRNLEIEKGAKTVRIEGGNRELRTLIEPRFLKVEDASAVLEDTRRGKRLWSTEGPELMNAHLSNLRFCRAESVATLIGKALELAKPLGFDGIFTAIPKRVWLGLREAFSNFQIQEARAGIYGYELASDCDWWVDSAEI